VLLFSSRARIPGSALFAGIRAAADFILRGRLQSAVLSLSPANGDAVFKLVSIQPYESFSSAFFVAARLWRRAQSV